MNRWRREKCKSRQVVNRRGRKIRRGGRRKRITRGGEGGGR